MPKKKEVNNVTIEKNKKNESVGKKKKVASKKKTKKKVTSAAGKKKKVSKASSEAENEKESKKAGKKVTKKRAPKTGYTLVIVESPSKAKTIKKYLGKGHEVIACNGHIKDLPKSKLGVDIEKKFTPEIVPISGKKQIFERLEKYTSNAAKIYLAPDPDREGEAIAFHLAEEIKGKKEVHRVLFNAVTKNAIIESMNNPTLLDQNKYDSQRARRVLDRLVGYKISPILWDKVQRGLSAGRVQSVALRLMVEREHSISQFVPEQWFSIKALIKNQDYLFEAKYYGESATKKTDLLDEKFVKQILQDIKGETFPIVDIKKRERKQSPTPPFTTAKMQQEAANKLGFTAKKTMMVAQKLYEGIEIGDSGMNGLITYMRTDSVRTEPGFLNELREYILDKYGKKYLSDEPIEYKKKKGGPKTQEAHEAIRPTNLEFAPNKIKDDLAPDELKLYTLIWNKFLSSQMAKAVIDQTTVLFDVKGHFFKVTGSVIKFAGFRSVYLESAQEKASKRGGADEEGDVDSTPSKSLPEMQVGDSFLPHRDVESQEHWTSPPPRYGDASIVKELEEKGIGRPSTYAAIISNIVDKGYVEKIETRYVPTELGMIVCQMLIESFPEVMDVSFTAQVEEQLDAIEDGGIKWTKLLKDFWTPFEKALEKAKEEMKNLKKTEIPTGVKCHKCDDGEYHIKWGRNGQFFACSNYPDCTSTQDFKKHLDGSYEIIPKQYTKDPCPSCGMRLVVKKGRYGRFLACEEYPQCKTALPYTLETHCPECQSGRFTERKGKYGKVFYGCSSYPECTNAMWNFPIEKACPSCSYPIMGKKETKRLGPHLYCPKCNQKFELVEDRELQMQDALG